MITLKKVLVPTDFDELAEVALTYARELARNFRAELHVLHVLNEEPGFAWGVPEDAYVPGYSFTEEGEKKVHKEMEKLLAEGERDNLTVRVAVRRGRPFAQIVRYAQAHAIDVIVMGTDGRGPIVHMLTGTGVAEQVVRKAPCPVLTVRQPEHEFVTA
ncbi:hypothetical protein AYO44_04040 [Planctomycetaceae bacterium SCGC AG-212-F19]|nr:hypothetical protein AYO44_04040 [Planctomycetaceae bacterium SCGC AG-212-F19]